MDTQEDNQFKLDNKDNENESNAENSDNELNKDDNESNKDDNELNKDDNGLNKDDNELNLNDVKIKSKNKTGVVYLSKIPPGRNYTRIREIFEKFAPIGNIYLVPDKLTNSKLQKKGKTYKNYKEGFIEFKRKKDAKNFTNIFNGATLKNSNNTDGFIWDIKYLHRVKWHHVMAKFKHNKAIEEQRLRLETEKAREAADHYLEMVNEWKKRGNKEITSDRQEKIGESLTKKQRKTKDELLKSKKSTSKKDDLNDLYESIFG